MKNTIFVNFLVVIFLLIFSISSCGKNTEKNIDESSGIIEQEQGLNGISYENDKKIKSINEDSKSISEQFASNIAGNITCSMELEEDGGIMNQKIYISGDKMRMDYNLTNDGIKIENHMISDGEYNYMWGDSGNFKMKIIHDIDDNIDIDNENEKIDGGFQDSKEFLDKIPASKCEKWDVDTQVFELPKGIDFMDFAELQKSMKTNISNIPQ
ncbi:MAG: hypothetical protein Q8K30_02930 [Candidatus Gracilibacteria bacterium]|nr:hypothetical protein [Candidatus Gracilibacteria bacterium]